MGAVRIPAVRFADDQAMVSYTVRVIANYYECTAEYSEKYNMRITTKKIKVIRISQVEGRPIRIKVNGQNLEKVKHHHHFII